MVSAYAKGKIVRLEKNGCIAVLATEDGEAKVDVNADFDLRLKVGDNLEAENASAYSVNGRIIAVINNDTRIVLNGFAVKFTPVVGT